MSYDEFPWDAPLTKTDLKRNSKENVKDKRSSTTKYSRNVINKLF